MLFAEAQAGVVYSKELYGLCIPAFSEVRGDEMEDAVISAAVQGQAKPDGHGFTYSAVKVSAQLRALACRGASRDPKHRREYVIFYTPSLSACGKALMNVYAY